MNELAAFCMGYLAKALIGYVLGKFIAHVIADIKSWPTILHYAENHEPRWSVDCDICNHTETKSVDTLVKAELIR